MIYAMSDIHDEYEKYRSMLDLIHFSDDDTLYVLGDVVDRSPQSAELLFDMASRPNVYPIMGNHEIVAIDMLSTLLLEHTEENFEKYFNVEFLEQVGAWQMNGGDSTIEAFRALRPDERSDLLDYMRDFSLYETVDVGDRIFILVHAGLQNFDEHRPLRDYAADELVLADHAMHRQYFSDPSIYIVKGHTPTPLITGKAEIYQDANNICIDCGASFPEGRLACLCLDTMEEFYV